MKKRFPHIIASLLITLGIFFFIFIFGKIPFIERIGNGVNDVFTYKLHYSGNRHINDIVIIKIDDTTLDTLGKSDLGMTAFDKGVYADIIEKLFIQYGSAVVGVDIIFANPSVLGKEDEQKLATVLDTYSDAVVIATRSDYTPLPLCIYSNVQHGVVNIPSQDIFRTFPLAPYNYDLSSYCSSAEIYTGNNPTISLFAREIVDFYVGKTNPFQKEKIQKNIQIFDAKTDDRAYIDYYSDGQQHTGTIGYESYSFVDIYNGLTQTTEGKVIDLKGKIVLIGEVGTTIQDSHFTPIIQSSKMPGVEINANIITTLMQGRDIQNISFVLLFFLFSLAFFLIISSVISLKIWKALSILIIICCSILGFGVWMFDIGYIINIFLGILGCALSFISAYIYRFSVSDKEKRNLKKQFSLYVSPDVVNEIINNPESILLKGEKRDMTLFFSDIESFTGISEKIDPEVLVEILNEYFSAMTHIIHKNKGTLDKYIGDAVMCFFNAPVKQENHSFYACKTALEQQKKLRELNVIWAKKGYPDIKIRIGIHSGQAVHGNIGSSDTRVNYTVIGDSVNLASRLEGVNKYYGTYICVSQDVYELQKDAFHFRELDVIEVKGREKPVRIYQLMAEKEAVISEKTQIYISRYQEALQLYQDNNFKKAQEIFSQNIGDKPSMIMEKRCQDIQEGKAELSQGIFQMKSK